MEETTPVKDRTGDVYPSTGEYCGVVPGIVPSGVSIPAETTSTIGEPPIPLVHKRTKKLTDRQVAEIRKLAPVINQTTLAVLCGVSDTTISKVVHGRAGYRE